MSCQLLKRFHIQDLTTLKTALYPGTLLDEELKRGKEHSLGQLNVLADRVYIFYAKIQL